MKSLLPAILILFLSSLNAFSAENEDKGFLIIGADSVQKIFYTTSSHSGINHDGRKAIDSDKKSSWISGSGGPHWFEIDFGTKRIMSSIILYPGKKDNYNTIKNFILQFKYDGSWFDFSSVSLEENTGSFFSKTRYKEKAVIDLGGIDASAFRIFIPEDATYNGFAAITEIETYVGQYRLKYFDERLNNLFMPVMNGFLPIEDESYPNAERKYRGGKHSGLDFYNYHTDDSYDPVSIDRNTPVYAAKEGTIIRADWNYTPMSKDEWREQSKYYQTHPRTFVKRSFGGIQVWIDHGDGIVTTYNHLSKIDDKITNGASVEKGQRIGWAGNSGMLAEAEGKNESIHLHFEIWIDGYYLGRGMSIRDIKKYFTWIFSVR